MYVLRSLWPGFSITFMPVYSRTMNEIILKKNKHETVYNIEIIASFFRGNIYTHPYRSSPCYGMSDILAVLFPVMKKCGRSVPQFCACVCLHLLLIPIINVPDSRHALIKIIICHNHLWLTNWLNATPHEEIDVKCSHKSFQIDIRCSTCLHISSYV